MVTETSGPGTVVEPAWDLEPASDLPTDWMDEAACSGADPELFFPDGENAFARARVRTAKQMCRECPVSLACLAWAMDTGQAAGIWGGRTEDERRRALHRRRWS